MTKKEQFVQAVAILDKHKIKGDAREEFIALLEPKTGGMTVNIDEVVTRDAEGNIVEVVCKLSGVSLPATEEFFYGDKNSKIVTASGFACSRTSKQAYKLKSDTAKAYRASKEAIMSDVLEGNVSPDAARDQLAAIPQEPDYSSVTAEVEVPVEEA